MWRKDVMKDSKLSKNHTLHIEHHLGITVALIGWKGISESAHGATPYHPKDASKYSATD